MAINAIEPTSDLIITVHNEAELDAAYDVLSKTPGGGTILLGEHEDDDGSYRLYERGGYTTNSHEPIVIKSEDPEDPAPFRWISLRDVENIRLENILVEPGAYGNGGSPLLVQGSTNIQIVDSTFIGTAEKMALVSEDKTMSMGTIRESQDIIFSGNTVEKFW
ncbi:MAG: hypothetical protein AAFQ06_11375, partial [Pseudomonadota bacterium]